MMDVKYNMQLIIILINIVICTFVPKAVKAVVKVVEINPELSFNCMLCWMEIAEPRWFKIKIRVH